LKKAKLARHNESILNAQIKLKVIEKQASEYHMHFVSDYNDESVPVLRDFKI